MGLRGALRWLVDAMLRVVYGRGCEALRGVANSGDAPDRERCALISDLAARCEALRILCQRFAERLREARRDRPQAFAPMRQRQCEFVRQRRSDPANPVRQLAEIARGKLAIFQRSSRKASTSARTGSMASSASESRLR